MNAVKLQARMSSIGRPWSISRRLAAGDFQAAAVEAEQVEHRGVEVGHVMALAEGVDSPAHRSPRGRGRASARRRPSRS